MNKWIDCNIFYSCCVHTLPKGGLTQRKQAVLFLTYFSGLRVGEIVRLHETEEGAKGS